ncbi:MAG: hypothetical protein LBF79_04145 [Dysgonamonadaceae bacterium]|nr:hypothetical protein [Dysgonamonadaceae bacterium]
MSDFRAIFGFVAVLTLFVSCGEGATGDVPVVRVNGSVLYRYELERSIPQGISSSDSIVAAEHFVRRWVIDELVYDIAGRNVRDIEQIDLMVERYRRSLLVFRYQEQLLDERFEGSALDSGFFLRRNEFLRETENEIYERALKRGEIHFY